MSDGENVAEILRELATEVAGMSDWREFTGEALARRIDKFMGWDEEHEDDDE